MATTRGAGVTGALLLALVAPPLVVAPAIVRGMNASAWVNHYAALEALPRPRRAFIRALLEKADLAVRNLAPLPQASAAAMRALGIGVRAEREDHDRETALLIYRGVRGSCATVRDRPFQGVGFAVIEGRAAALERAMGAAPEK